MAATAPARERLLTIGTVCRRLKPEFPDISISKIRYLEDQGLLTPKRTQGGYRLFAEDDVERLETILRLQRDEFLPLRVIREELASGATEKRRRKRTGRARRAGGRARPRRALRACGHRRAARARARGVRTAGAARRERAADLHRERRRHRRRMRDARRATGSRRGTCARSARPSTARQGCSTRSIAPGAALTKSGAAPGRGGGPPGDGRSGARALPAPLLAQHP